MITRQDTERNTAAVINSFKGLPGEYNMLKGLLCADHPMAYGEPMQRRYASAIDTRMIAARMDEINAGGNTK